MKVQKLFTIDAELIEQLRQEENMSGTVNLALKDYFEKKRTLKLSLDKRKELVNILKQKEELEAKAQDIINNG